MAGYSEDVCREVTFPVPWGIIAAKTWGDPCSKPCLMLHGIQDNAGTFDRLIPLLPRGFYYVCLDLPGHGLSSRLPKGGRLDFMQYVLSVNRVVVQLQWSEFYLIGHSLGGQLSQYYAAMFPEQIIKLVSIDVLGPHSISLDNYLLNLRKVHKHVMALEEKVQNAEPPSYTMEMALEKIIKNRRTFISEEAAKKLLPRSIKKGKNGYYFSSDQRLKLFVMLPLTHYQHCENYRKIRSPFLLVITRGLYNYLGLDDPALFKESFVGVFHENPLFEMVIVEGAHDVHNNEPEVVSSHISKFLLKQKSSL